MKITICGSIAFQSEINSVKKKMELLGHEVKIWPLELKDGEGNLIPVEEYYKIRKSAANDEKWVWDRKAEAILEHFNKVAWSDAILVLNYDKKGVKGYIGGNTLMEMGLAFYLKKKIYILNEVPELSYKEEILGVKPLIINGDLSKLNEK
ncbi:MAG: hypothetical protein PHW72_02280 [Candidatus Pacebacteria bacterium]|nr:hypothetical protein [Candidatus Paceibacterota bacterium]